MNRMNISIFLLTLVVLFLYPILPQYVYIVGGVNVVNGLLAFYCLVFIFFYGRLSKIRRKDNIIFYWLYLLMMAISYVVDSEILKTATFVLSFILLPWIIISVVNTEERFVKVIDTLISAGAILGIFGVIESILKFNFFQPLAAADIEFFHEIRYGLLRIMTTFGQPISYGLYQVFIVALINYRKGAFGEKKWLKVCYAISVLNIFLSVSRIPIIAFLLIQVLILYRGSKRQFNNYLVYSSIGLLFALIVSTSTGFRIPLVDDLLETINQLLSGNTASTGSTVGFGNRFDLWAWVYLSMGDKWIIGHGPTAQFAYKVYEWQTKTSIENQYLYVLWHNGIVGLVMLLLSYISILRFSFKRRDKYLGSKEELSFNIIVFILMAVYYVVELGGQESDVARIYTVLIALLISYNRIESMRSLDDENRINGI